MALNSDKLRWRGTLFFLRETFRNPRDAFQILASLPRLFIHQVIFRKPILLIQRHSGIGDIICTFPSVAALKKANPETLIAYETQRSYLALPRLCRYVDLAFADDSLLALFLHRTFKPTRTLHPSLPDEYEPPRPREKIHLSEEFGRSFGLPMPPDQIVHLKSASSARRQIRRKLNREGIDGKKRLIVIHTGPTWEVKEWPVEKWHELIDDLKSEEEMEVIQIGEDLTGTRDARKSPRVAGAMDWIGTLTLDQTLALLSEADLFVGIDSGMLHLAGTVCTPCVGIFGPTDPDSFLPRNSAAFAASSRIACIACHHDPQGPQHWRSGCANNIACMAELEVKDVAAACHDLLKPLVPRKTIESQ